MRHERSQRALLPTRPLLVSESRHRFDVVYNELEKELMPQGIIERMYVTDAAYIFWEIVRLRSCRVALINTVFRDALVEVLKQVLPPLRRYHSRDDEFEDQETVETRDDQGGPGAERNPELSEGEAETDAEVGEQHGETDNEPEEDPGCVANVGWN
jgi:hypothetical protein